MSHRLLRIEATNIYDNLLDCTQLSVMRGASLGMRSIVKQLERAFAHSLVAVSTGASTGVFELKPGGDATAIRRDVTAYLQRFAGDIATFVVDVTESDDAVAAIERAIALNRFRQMREASVVWTDNRLRTAPGDEQSDSLCAWSDRWPAHAAGPERDGDVELIAGWVRHRYDLGHGSKQVDERTTSKQADDQDKSFYRRELTPPGGEAISEEHERIRTRVNRYRFAHDLNEIARLPDKRNLDGKIAVIYADGNQFSKVQRDAIEAAGVTNKLGVLQAFDQKLQTLRRGLLATVLQPYCHDKRTDLRAPTHRNDGEFLRLETLLWGGDELTMVVPAWHGLDFLASFFAHTEDWKFGEVPLTHAVGVVFAHAKTPIHRLDGMARLLADEVKDELKKQSRRENAWSYLVLESVDVLEQSPEHYRQQRYGSLQPSSVKQGMDDEAQNPCKRPATLLALAPAIAELKPRNDEIRHGSLRWIRDATTLPLDDRGLLRRKRRFKSVIDEAKFNALDAQLRALFPPLAPLDADLAELWRWAHLCELWDYLPDHANAPSPAAQEAAA